MRYRFISFLLVLVLVLSCIPAAAAHPFRDVGKTDWYAADVEFAYEKGLLNGVSASSFGPNESMTRAMLVTVLWRMAGQPRPTGTSRFRDVAAGKWYSDAVCWAAENGVVNGTEPGIFSPNAPITREQTAAILYRYCQSVGYLTPSEGIRLADFADGSRVSGYAEVPVAWAIRSGLIQGSREGSRNYLLPKDRATRAQMAAILHRFCGMELEIEKNPVPETKPEPKPETVPEPKPEKSAGQAIPPVVSFVDDDGRVEIYTELYPWMQAQNVPYTFAISSRNIGVNGLFANAGQLRGMQENPLVTFSCHCLKDTAMSSLTAEELEQILSDWFGDMQTQGLIQENRKPLTYMYCQGSYQDPLIAQVVQKYFKAGFTVEKGINTTPFDSFHMNRVGLFPTNGGFSLADAKAYVDEVFAKGGWLVFLTHCYNASFDLDELTELVAYIREKGVEIASVEDVLRRYGNRADSGMFNKERPYQKYSVTDYLGNTYSSDGPVAYDFAGTPTPVPGKIQ